MSFEDKPPAGEDGVRHRSLAACWKSGAAAKPVEMVIKCPRCDSTDTKFCYYNNYNLTQPRHFCKTCRRYWTKGGALRNVPIGGGCRRSKKMKSTTCQYVNSGDHPKGWLGRSFMESALFPARGMGFDQMGSLNFSRVQYYPPNTSTTLHQFSSLGTMPNNIHPLSDTPQEIGSSSFEHLTYTTMAQKLEKLAKNKSVLLQNDLDPRKDKGFNENLSTELFIHGDSIGNPTVSSSKSYENGSKYWSAIQPWTPDFI